MSKSPSLSPELRTHLDEGIRRFNAGLFWEAHEAWEEAWLTTDGNLKLWIQGLIQLTAAFHKGLRMNNAAGMARLFEQSAEKLAHVSSDPSLPCQSETTALLTLAREGHRKAVAWSAGGLRPWSDEPLPQLNFPMDHAGNLEP